MRRLINIIDGAVSRLEAVLIAVFAISALALGTAQVVMRYVFNTGFVWSEAVFVLLTVAGMLFAGSRAVRDDVHVRVDLLPMLMPKRAQTAFRLFRYVATLLLCGYFFNAGLQYVLFTKSMGVVSPSSQIPVWISYLLVPITMGLFCLRYVLLLLREASGEATGSSGHGEALGAADDEIGAAREARE